MPDQPTRLSLKTTYQEAIEIIDTAPLHKVVDQLLRLVVEQRIDWGESGGIVYPDGREEEMLPVPDDSVLRLLVYRNNEREPAFAVVSVLECHLTTEGFSCDFLADGDADLLDELAGLKLVSIPW